MMYDMNGKCYPDKYDGEGVNHMMYDINCPEDFDGDVSVSTTPLSGKDYYNGTDCFDAIRKFLGEDGTKAWIKGNVLKYLYRYNGKDGLSDLNKALEYLSMLLEMEIRK